MTSPNSRTTSVVTPIARPIPLSPKKLTATSVAIAEMPMFTSVLPARIAVRTRCGRPAQRRHAHRVARPPCLASAATRENGSAVSAVSTPEKNAERTSPTSSSAAAVPIPIAMIVAA